MSESLWKPLIIQMLTTSSQLDMIEISKGYVH